MVTDSGAVARTMPAVEKMATIASSSLTITPHTPPMTEELERPSNIGRKGAGSEQRAVVERHQEYARSFCLPEQFYISSTNRQHLTAGSDTAADLCCL